MLHGAIGIILSGPLKLIDACGAAESPFGADTRIDATLLGHVSGHPDIDRLSSRDAYHAFLQSRVQAMFYLLRVGSTVQDEYRLTPGMTSRKLQVVSFVKQYISRWGQWPSYGEIAGAMGITSSTARDAVKRAVRDKLLYREPGSRKGVVKVSDTMPRLCPSEAADMLKRLRAAGVIVMDTKAGSAAPTFYPLPISPPFRHLPDIE